MKPGRLTVKQMLNMDIEGRDYENDDGFRILLKRIMNAIPDLNESLISERIGVSKPTVRHWLTGESVPHPLVQRRLFKDLLK